MKNKTTRRDKNEDTIYICKGSIKENTSEIQNLGLVVAPVAYVMLRRLECVAFPQESEEWEQKLWKGDLYTGDAFVAYPSPHLDDHFRYVHDFFKKYDIDKFCELNPTSGQGVYKFRDEKFEPLDGILFHPGKDGFPMDYCHMTLTLKRTLNSRLWKTVARHPEFVNKDIAWDSRLLEEYARCCVFPLSKKAMPLFLGAFPHWDTELGIAYLTELDAWEEGNSALFRKEEIENPYRIGLLEGCGIVIGITPETLEDARHRSTEVCNKLVGMSYPKIVGGELHDKSKI